MKQTGGGHPSLYRRLVEKHARSYQAHLPALLIRRARDLATLRRHNHDLELEYDTGIAAEVAKMRDDVAALDTKLKRKRIAAEHARAAGEIVSARAEIERNAAERAHAAIVMAGAREEIHASHIAVRHARAEAAALRNSWSWRVTAPLRGLYEMLLLVTFWGRPR
jgi:hypothetical protein